VASATAPNLIDPVYAGLVGILARLGAGTVPARERIFSPSRIAAVAILVGVSISVAVLALDITSDRPPNGRTPLRQLAHAQNLSHDELVTGREISAAGEDTPSEAVLRWWELVQFGASSQDIISTYASQPHRTTADLRKQLQRERPVILERKPFVIDETIQGNRAWVLTVLSRERLRSNRPDPGSIRLFELRHDDHRWRLVPSVPAG
jgi:hypothetical protein